MTVSFILATRDRPEWVGRAIRSVMVQTDPRWELVVLDNGATSARSAVPKDDRIRYFYRPASGPADAFDQALLQATGDLVMPMGDDDFIAPHTAATILNGIGDHQWGYALTAFQRNGETLFLLGGDWSLERLRQDYYLGGAVFWRRSLSERLGGFDPAYDGAADYDLYLRFGEDSEPVVLPEVLYFYNDHPLTDTNVRAANQRLKAQAIREKAAA